MHIGFEDSSTLSARDRLRALLRAVRDARDARQQARVVSHGMEFLYGKSARRLPRGERALLLGALKRCARALARSLEEQSEPPHLPAPRPPGEPPLKEWFETRGLPQEDDVAGAPPELGSIDDALEWATDAPFREPTSPMLPSHKLPSVH